MFFFFVLLLVIHFMESTHVHIHNIRHTERKRSVEMDGDREMHDAIFFGNFRMVKRLIARGIHADLDIAIAYGQLEIAQWIWNKGGRSKPKNYQNGIYTPIHNASEHGKIAMLKWIFDVGILTLDKINTKDGWNKTPLDRAIATGQLEAAKWLQKKGGRPNLGVYCDKRHTAVHSAVVYDKAATLEWVFAESVLPQSVFQIKNGQGMTPLDIAIEKKHWQIANLLGRLLHLDPVFLAMQRAKRDYHQCVLRRLPDELLDTIVEEVAARFYLKVKW